MHLVGMAQKPTRKNKFSAQFLPLPALCHRTSHLTVHPFMEHTATANYQPHRNIVKLGESYMERAIKFQNIMTYLLTKTKLTNMLATPPPTFLESP